MDHEIEFQPFSKIPRLTRECIITEKIDGTNAQIYISDDLSVILAGSRSRWLTPGKGDNFGFATWVEEHQQELILALGPGRHFGEWWGKGIQRGYGLKEKRFSLFNTSRWTGRLLPTGCFVVPILYQGLFHTEAVEETIRYLHIFGSHAAPGFDKPEGVVIFHVAGNLLFKKTLEKDESPKGE